MALCHDSIIFVFVAIAAWFKPQILPTVSAPPRPAGDKGH